jgi:hypothetical protein
MEVVEKWAASNNMLINRERADFSFYGPSPTTVQTCGFPVVEYYRYLWFEVTRDLTLTDNTRAIAGKLY